MIVLIAISFAISLVLALVFVRNARSHAKRYSADMPQRFHRGDIPRIGGMAILLGVCGSLLVAGVAYQMGNPFNIKMTFLDVVAWFCILLPAVLGGVYEDVTQRLGVRYRLALTAVSAGLACWLLGLNLDRLGLPLVDQWLAAAPWIGIALAVLALCGLPHAFNIIDGYNGLAGTVAIFISLALAHVALQNGDRQLAGVLLCLVGATAGFIVWNYPRGLIFAGDGGAYLWGLVIAVVSVLLVQRHPLVSPWFPMLLLMYPVWETVFSIYRKAVRGQSPSLADALHFHQLIYRRIVREVFHDDNTRRMLMRNNRTSPYLWSFTLLTVGPAVLFWQNTGVLMFFCALFIVSYVYAYVSIVRFKVPRWIPRARQPSDTER